MRAGGKVFLERGGKEVKGEDKQRKLERGKRTKAGDGERFSRGKRESGWGRETKRVRREKGGGGEEEIKVKRATQ